MALFAIVGLTSLDILRTKVKEVYQEEVYGVSDSCWIIVDKVSAREVSDKLNISGGKLNATAMIIRFSQYWGHGPKDLWDWVASRQAEDK